MKTYDGILVPMAFNYEVLNLPIHVIERKSTMGKELQLSQVIKSHTALNKNLSERINLGLSLAYS